MPLLKRFPARTLCRIGVGFSTTGTMAGTASSVNNAVIGIPGTGAAQYELQGNTLATIVAAPSSLAGTTNMAVWQAGGVTTMTWTRQANNGIATDAQISLTGATLVIWAFGSSNTYTDNPLPVMAWSSLDLAGVLSPSSTPSPSASAGASPTPAPTYPYSVQLTTPLKLSWNRNGNLYNFKAVLTKVAWCVAICVSQFSHTPIPSHTTPKPKNYTYT